jgi:predicted transcriptional regulator
MPLANFHIEVEWQRLSGKFASREEIVTEIADWLEEANAGEVSGVGADGDSEYEIVSWSVEEVSK